ncbi:MAG: hypothetical protein DUD27_00080 [Lachnospiraceae bacterium]|uniref:Type VII secretion system protein EssD-like domain-containing protein n=1 Tax=Candidatus Weimeria bifida TaxID=2599074 RepID=A0A6N7J2R0_9FIRM|nr:hypothetical protein [Candidatus Weimeria bifida]RRF97313.1 MAG: hypothetical protein DUD27_00080 [Lachnospiraceae bacterium]
MKKNFFKKFITFPAGIALAALLIVSPLVSGCTQDGIKTSVTAEANPVPRGFKYAGVPKWNKKSPYVKIHKNKPYFSKNELKGRKSYEKYGKLDSRGRCTLAVSCIGTNLMPTAKRGAIGMVKPTGWHTVKYAGIDGNYLYNRCHLIGYQLTGENANRRNLITGTRYMNVEGMEPFETKVAQYLHSHRKSHVLYRVTPVFKGNDKVARGVLMEAQSIEDRGRGIKFCVFCYNVQPGVTIKYSDGSSRGPAYNGRTPSTRKKTVTSRSSQSRSGTHTYVLNTNTKKFHKPSCSSIKRMSARNKKTVKERRKDLINQGYSPCKRCNP